MTACEIVEVEHFSGDHDVFNLSTTDEWYTANGIALHNCRCSMRILTEDEMQAELQGQWGGRGVGPGNARLGPDLNDDVSLALDKWKREQKGEVVGDNRPPWQVERDEKREAPAERNPGWTDDAYERPRDVPVTPEPADEVDDHDDPFAEHERLFDDDPDDELDDDEPDRSDDDRPDDSADEQAGEDDDVPASDDNDDRALNEQFDDHFADAIAAYTPEQRDAIHRWQGMDRFYQRVQNVVRDDADDEEAAEVAEHLDDVIQQSQLREDTTLWRGIRDSQQVFGVANADLPQLIGETIPSPGFLAATTSRDVAVGFTDPSLRGGHVLLELRFRAGTAVAWIAGAGDPELADQFEALFGAALAIHLLSVEYTGNVPTVVAEVTPIDDAE